MGDLIDRNKLLEVLDKMVHSLDERDYPQELMIDGIVKAIDLVDEAPAIDAKPVCYGRNGYDGNPVDGFICSECGFHTEDVQRYLFDEDGDYYYLVEYRFKYCPNCGAKMDGGTNDA